MPSSSEFLLILVLDSGNGDSCFISFTYSLARLNRPELLFPSPCCWHLHLHSFDVSQKMNPFGRRPLWRQISYKQPVDLTPCWFSRIFYPSYRLPPGLCKPWHSVHAIGHEIYKYVVSHRQKIHSNHLCQDKFDWVFLWLNVILTFPSFVWPVIVQRRLQLSSVLFSRTHLKWWGM